MNDSICRDDAGLNLGGGGPATFDEFGRGSPIVTCHTPRPGEGRDGDTPSRRWCL